jgi:Restriction endonuclease
VSEYRDYENGVADVLAFLAGDAATVERNVELPTRDGKRRRQVDVVVRGRIFGLTDATAIVDCKRWGKPIDVSDIGSFIDLVDDVRADVGLMVSTEGATSGAQDRIGEVRGVRLETMTLDELKAWRPRGTVTTSYRIPAERQPEAEKALRNAGLRVVLTTAYETPEGDVVLEAFRHYGTSTPDGDVQRDHAVRAETALRQLGLDPIHVAGGVSIGGGTPAHRWLEIAVDGVPTGHRILAASETEAEQRLDQAAEDFLRAGISREALSVIKPEGWPVPPLFVGWTP